MADDSTPPAILFHTERELMRIVAGDRVIVGRSPPCETDTVVLASDPVELTCRVTPYCNVRFSIAVVVGLTVKICARDAPKDGNRCIVRAAENVPSQIGRWRRSFAHNCIVRLAITVVVARNE